MSEKNNYVIKKEKCTGCMTCLQTCKFGAIKIEIDKEGFEYPTIDETKCIKCNCCTNVCPILNIDNVQEEKQKHPKVLAAWSKDSENRKRSSSGGCFTEIAKRVLDKHGVVYGVRL